MLTWTTNGTILTTTVTTYQEVVDAFAELTNDYPLTLRSFEISRAFYDSDGQTLEYYIRAVV